MSFYIKAKQQIIHYLCMLQRLGKINDVFLKTCLLTVKVLKPQRTTVHQISAKKNLPHFQFILHLILSGLATLRKIADFFLRA